MMQSESIQKWSIRSTTIYTYIHISLSNLVHCGRNSGNNSAENYAVGNQSVHRTYSYFICIIYGWKLCADVFRFIIICMSPFTTETHIPKIKLDKSKGDNNLSVCVREEFSTQFTVYNMHTLFIYRIQ